MPLFSVKYRKLFLPLLAALLLASCEDEESSLGLPLQTNPPYDGINAIIPASSINAYTCYDDSLYTSGDTVALIGRYSDPVFGLVEARCYSQLALTNTNGLDFSQFVIDSAILKFAVSTEFPQVSSQKSLHIRVFQLAEQLDASKVYYATDSVAIGSTAMFDGVVPFDSATSSISLPLNAAFISLLNGQRFENQQQFQSSVKGFCLTVASDSDPLILTLALGSSASGLRIYYHQISDTVEHDVSILFGHASSAS